MINLTDTHCHIQSIGKPGGDEVTSKMWAKLESSDVDTVIADAKRDDVNKLIVVGCNLDDSKLAIELAQSYDGIWASIGIHPHEADKYPKDNPRLHEFASLINNPKVVAIGECGLDYYYQHSDPKAQQAVLRYQLKLAKENNLAVIFHVREAFDDFWPIFDEFTGLKGVLHSFTDNMTNLEAALKRNLLIGVNGIATFTKDQNQTTMYRAIPVGSLVLETDAPFLTPAPFRGTINQPKYIRLVAEYLAGLRGQSLATLADQTTRNANKLFSL